MFLRQVYDPHLAQYAYVIGCQKTGEAIVIDPLRDVDQYLSMAAAEGMKLSAVAETHIHADFVSGARELALAHDLDVYISAEGGSEWQSEWAGDLPTARLLHDGDVFRIGNIKFDVMHTPGHTPEHVSFLVTDEGGGANEPLALLSGDFLFVGDVGRPDLLEQAAGMAGTQEHGARQLYASLRKLGSLPDHLQVLPAHGAGSACGKSLGAVPFSTLGYEKKFNHPLKLAFQGAEEGFVQYILDGQPEPPLYFAEMKRVNRLGPAVTGKLRSLKEVTLAEVTPRLNEENFVVLDSRSDRKAFARNHLKGSLYAPKAGDFSGFAGSYLLPDNEIVLLVESGHEAQNLYRQLLRIGFDHVKGWMPQQVLNEATRQQLVSSHGIKFDAVGDLLLGNPKTVVLDVRRATEYAAGHLHKAVNIAHTRLRQRMDELSGDVPVMVHCQSGNRAAAAAAWLQRCGRRVIYINDSFTNVPAGLLA